MVATTLVGGASCCFAGVEDDRTLRSLFEISELLRVLETDLTLIFARAEPAFFLVLRTTFGFTEIERALVLVAVRRTKEDLFFLLVGALERAFFDFIRKSSPPLVAAGSL